MQIFAAMHLASHPAQSSLPALHAPIPASHPVVQLPQCWSGRFGHQKRRDGSRGAGGIVPVEAEPRPTVRTKVAVCCNVNVSNIGQLRVCLLLSHRRKLRTVLEVSYITFDVIAVLFSLNVSVYLLLLLGSRNVNKGTLQPRAMPRLTWWNVKDNTRTN